MRHAYMIMAHAQPELLKKILTLLDHEDNDFIIHLDIKSPLTPDMFIPYVIKGRIFFVKRLSITWGHFNMTRAEYLLMEKAREIGDHDYYHFITGQDFPLKPVEEITEFFCANAGKEFIHYSRDDFSQGRYLDRQVVKYPLLERCGRTKNGWYYINRLFVYAQMAFYKIFKPKWSAEKYLAGSQFFSITQPCLEYLLSHKDDTEAKYQYGINGDESFVQTLVYNSKFYEALYVMERNGDMRSNMRYIDWDRGTGSSPATITLEDVPAVLESGMMFARKVDLGNHRDAIEAIEQAIRKAQAH